MHIMLVLLLLLGSSVFSTIIYAKNVSKTHDYRPTILLSIDGFAQHYLAEYKPKNILKFAKEGVTTDALIPVFPTKTFPNHLSIVTGNYPNKHGLVHNRFYNRELNQHYKMGIGKLNKKWVTSPTLWSIAEKNNVKTGIYFWPESELNLPNNTATYNFPYKHNTPDITRFNQIIDWLKLSADERPELVLGYFSTIDSIGHDFGIHSNELATSINNFDKLLGKFLDRIKHELTFDVNIILVSDHGMTDISEDRLSYFHLFDGVESVQVVNGQTQLYVYLENESMEDETLIALKKNVKDKEMNFMKFHKFKEFPVSWNFNTRSPVMPNIVVEILPPYTFGTPKDKGKATHGYGPKLTDQLNAIFIANGPSFKKGLTIEAFENIHILPIILEIYGIKAPNDIDGKREILYPILQ